MNWREILYKSGAKKRNPSLYKHFNDLLSTDFSDRKELDLLQLESLQRFLIFAYTNSPWNAERMKRVDFNPAEDFSIENFKKITPIGKEELVQNNEKIQVEEEFFDKVFYCESSGTSGKVLTFKRDENWDSFNRAAQMRGYSWFGVNPWDFNIYFWGYNSNWKKKLKLRVLDFFVNRNRMFDYSETSLKSLRSKLKNAVFIEGYSSMIYEMAKLGLDQPHSLPNLKMIKGTSEKIFPHYQEVVKKAFGRKIISEYGAAEAGIIAFECPEGNMHITEEGVYVEQDENGEILITNMLSYSFPVIRYRLGDSIKLADDNFKCACGRSHKIINEVTGRVGKIIVGFKKQYPSLTLYYIFKNIYFEKGLAIDYQATQSEKGKLIIRFLEKLDSKKEDLILEQAKIYFKDDIKIEFEQVSSFRMEKGKLRDFISYIS
ncbi:phenylacetate--CoA ligase family protein [Algoriphagus marinus]|uniref:phenylacetate--CoA ligase family protein n=1 Tax=Algoriphagus marinus TaxID=1925762 RepID=UPI00094B7CC8|nr:phenylacetate--CoA ligase family protein [Algoriphagus marinus]